MERQSLRATKFQPKHDKLTQQTSDALGPQRRLLEKDTRLLARPRGAAHTAAANLPLLAAARDPEDAVEHEREDGGLGLRAGALAARQRCGKQHGTVDAHAAASMRRGS